MFRLVFAPFGGTARPQAVDHAHESPPIMTLPLVALAIPSALAGFWGIDALLARQFGGGHLEYHVIAMVTSLAAVFFGISLAAGLYRKASSDPLPTTLAALSAVLRNRFYLDEIYEGLFVRFQDLVATVTAGFDRWIIAGLFIRGLHGTTELAGRGLRLLQTGNLQTYAFLFVLGTALVLYLVSLNAISKPISHAIPSLLIFVR